MNIYSDGDRTDFVDVLLKIQREKSVGFDIDRVSIKAIILVRGRISQMTILVQIQ